MTSAQSIRTRINDLLDAGGPSDRADVGQIAAAYAQLSAEANARLRTCLDLLRRGLRSEAIHHAEAEPELFGLIQSLDFRRMEEWTRFCVEHGLERPRPLFVDAVKAINDALVEEQRLQPLLRRHRDQALRRAPLRARVDTLRALAEADPRNPTWTNDVRVFEAARLREIEAILAGGKGAQDLQACNALLTELVDTRWRERPRPIVVQAARAALAAAQRRWAEAECGQLLPQMHAAQDAWDVSTAERLRSRWNEVLNAAAIGESDLPEDLRNEWEPVGAWYAAHERRRAAEEQFAALSDALRDAVRAKGPLDRLETIHGQLREFNRPLEESLKHDYDVLASSLQLARARRQRARLATLVAAAIVVLAVLGVAASDLLARRAAESRAQEALAALDIGDLATAHEMRRVTAGWQPLVLGRGAWRSTLTEMDEALARGEQRAAAFAAAMQRIDDADPANVTDAMLQSAERLALGDAEQRRLDDARRAVDQQRAEQLQRRDAMMLEQIARASEWLGDIDGTAIDQNPRGVDATLSGIERELHQVRSEAAGRVAVLAAMAPVEARAKGLRAAVDRAVAVVERQDAQARALQALPRQGHDGDNLADALKAFVEAFPDSPQSADFARAAGRRDEWRAVDAWEALAGTWRSGPAPRNAAEAATRLQAVRGYLDKHPLSPLRPRVERYEALLSAVVLVSSPSDPWQDHLRAVLKQPLISELDTVETVDGRRFYVPPVSGDKKPFRQTSLGTHIQLALQPDLLRLQEVTFDPGVLKLPPSPSPQKTLARDVRQALDTLDPAEAEVGPLRITAMILNAENVDPILRALLATVTAEKARGISDALAADVDAWLAPLRGFDLEHARWMDGFDDGVAELRAAVNGALSQIEPVETRIAAARRRNAEAVAGVDFRIVSRGVVMRRDEVAVVEPVSAFPPGDASLQAVTPTAGGRTELRTVGALRGGVATLDPAAAATLPAGSLVFVTR